MIDLNTHLYILNVKNIRYIFEIEETCLFYHKT